MLVKVTPATFESDPGLVIVEVLAVQLEKLDKEETDVAVRVDLRGLDPRVELPAREREGGITRRRKEQVVSFRRLPPGEEERETRGAHLEERDDHADDGVTAQASGKDFVHASLAQEGLDEEDERPRDAVVDRVGQSLGVVDFSTLLLAAGRLPFPFPFDREPGRGGAWFDVAFFPKGVLLEDGPDPDCGVDPVLLVDAQVDREPSVARREFDDGDSSFRDDDEGLRGGDGRGQEEGRESVQEGRGGFEGRRGHRGGEDDEVNVASGEVQPGPYAAKALDITVGVLAPNRSANQLDRVQPQLVLQRGRRDVPHESVRFGVELVGGAGVAGPVYARVEAPRGAPGSFAVAEAASPLLLVVLVVVVLWCWPMPVADASLAGVGGRGGLELRRLRLRRRRSVERDKVLLLLELGARRLGHSCRRTLSLSSLGLSGVSERGGESELQRRRERARRCFRVTRVASSLSTHGSRVNRNACRQDQQSRDKRVLSCLPPPLRVSPPPPLPPPLSLAHLTSSHSASLHRLLRNPFN